MDWFEKLTGFREGNQQHRVNGFEYGPTPPDNICANMQTIHVLKSGAVCEIGPLVPASR